MKLRYILFIMLCVFFYIVGQKAISPEKEINDEFRIVFEQEEEFYLLDNILTVKEKEKTLLNLKENTPEVKKELFNKILMEKKEEISLIGNYKKEEWKKENESIISFENKIRKTWDFIQSPAVKILGLMIVILIAIYAVFRSF
ncbi:hypothetical protein HMPREF2775_05150 [Fusobacterium sp. HMSC064B12]|uniref:hypothetical protein n=1 Tax=Fusobacterium sp. HMSC064B12 TaxID=1739279 RepID=UPI0008A3CC74|nr:hypothetical protein [Fusobacterium sp. HMSC064B12]OFL29796.1 hypothetical protein HMPREF2775_05150 [Fusobacterium sp. HMSC064B12]